MEPECCVAIPLDNGGVKLFTTDQSAHTTQHECAAMLGVDFAHCQVENMLVGGGFGGTAQAFVPLDKLAEFKEKTEAVLGRGRCHTVMIRPAGGIRLG